MCDEVSDYTGEILRHISYQFNNYLGYSLEKLLSVYRAGKFPGLMGQENYTPQEMLNLDRRLNESLQNTSLYDKLISDILIIGKNGYVYNTQERSNLQSGYPFEEQDWFKEYILSNTGDKNHICLIPAHPCDYYNPYHGTSDNEVFSMGMKITDKNGEYLGELLFNFNIQEVSELLNLGNYEHNGDIYLLDTKGNIIFQSSIFPVSGSSFEISEEKKAEIYNNHAGNFFTKIGGTFSLISYQTTNYDWKIVYIVPFNSLMNHNASLFRSVLLIFLAFIGVNFVASKWAAKSINEPVNRLESNIRKVDFRDMWLETSAYNYQELNTIAQRFNELLHEVNELINKEYKAQIQINKLRLYSLRHQLNPHFLMNTLQLLQTEIICGNERQANSIVVSISRLLQYSLYNASDEVPISDEIGYIKRYLGLMSLKYEGMLNIQYDLNPACNQYLTPKMILQPVIENCFTHGFKNSIDHAEIYISSTINEKGVTFIIRDNGEGMTEESSKNLCDSLSTSNENRANIGIANVHQRIQLIYGNSFGLSLKSAKWKGTVVSIKIPLLKGHDDSISN